MSNFNLLAQHVHIMLTTMPSVQVFSVATPGGGGMLG